MTTREAGSLVRPWSVEAIVSSEDSREMEK